MTSMTVMVIEDHEDSVDLLKFMLDSFGYAVQHCPSRNAACEVFLIALPDVILMDLRVPGMPIPEFLSVVSKLKTKIEIVLMSSDLGGEDVAKEHNLYWLAKPFKTPALLEAIRKCTS